MRSKAVWKAPTSGSGVLKKKKMNGKLTEKQANCDHMVLYVIFHLWNDDITFISVLNSLAYMSIINVHN